ncbi:MAG: hypothetical protein HY718_14905 [Planctomycetes bacterium]|nr:hypothetical protein [Planctomycetota bacterium]
MRGQRHQTASGSKRRASGYVLVLGATLLISVIGLTSLTLVRVQYKVEQSGMDAIHAQMYARSGVELALSTSYVDSSWRANYASYTALMPLAFDKGTCSIAISEADGSALDTATDNPVLLTGVGTVGSAASPHAVYKWSVSAHQPAMEFLRTALHAAGSITVSGGTITAEDGPLSTNQTLTNLGTINGDVEAKVLLNAGSISGSITVNAPAKSMPSSTALDFYRSRATTLPAASIGSTLQWVVLSPQSNPYGSANADGLYYIKPGGNLTIKNCRIVGTLVVELFSGRTLTLDQGLLWQTARADYPALVLSGSCDIQMEPTLYESNLLSFNPPGTPYRGQSDTDKVDSYPSSIGGLIHVIGSTSSVLVQDSSQIVGCLVAEGPVELRNTPKLTADLDFLVDPPQRYRSSWLVLDPGTWTRITP